MADVVARTRSRRRRPLRDLRKRLTGDLIRAAFELAPRMPDAALPALEQAIVTLLQRFGPPLVGGVVRDRLRRAGIYRPGIERDYLRQVGMHLASAIFVFKHGAVWDDAGDAAARGGDRFGIAGEEGEPRAFEGASLTPALSLEGRGSKDASRSQIVPAIRKLARERIVLDDSLRHLHAAAAEGRGVIIAAPHICQFVLGLARLAEEAPLTVYLRYSRDELGRRVKQAWCRATGLNMIVEPGRATDPAARAARLAEALAEGRILVITPDIPQRRDRGIPVNLFRREMNLAAGVASLAQLTGAPVLPVSAREVNGGGPSWCRPRRRNCIVLHEPLRVPTVAKGRGWRREALRLWQQQWADRFESFLRAAPHLWLHWLDHRWGRVLRNDQKYARPAPQADAAPQGAAGVCRT